MSTLRLLPLAGLLVACTLLAGCNASQSQPETITSKAPVVANTVPTAPAVTAPAIAAENGSGNAAPQSFEQYQRSLARRCETDSDCVVKNVGNCCGYLPQCVHKDVQTFPEQVKQLCVQEGRNSICGFQEPAGCSCIENQCRNVAANLQ